MGLKIVPKDIAALYDVHEWKHALAVLSQDFPKEWKEICEVLRAFRLKRSHVVAGGKNRSQVSRALDSAFYEKGWVEKKFTTKIVVDEATIESPTHKVDCFKNCIALEIEWSNKDPFFDRDLNNFRLLFELRATSVGVIITKSDELATILKAEGIWSKYGKSTTWLSKLLPRIEGGGGGGCPIVVFAITPALWDVDVTDAEAAKLKKKKKVADDEEED